MPLKQTPYQGISTFLKAPVASVDVRPIGVVGIPFDSTTSFRPGARFAPSAIREASKMLTDGEHPVFGIDPSLYVSDWGDIVTGSSAEPSLAAITKFYADHFCEHASNKLFGIGGDHLVSLGVLRGLRYSGRFNMDKLKLVIWDAHGDVWSDNFGEKYGHGTWVYHAIEENLVRAENVLQIGVRSPVDRATARWLRDRGGTHISVDQVNDDYSSAMYKIIGFLTDMRDTAPLWYMSIDIDCLDPSMAPATGTPEIAGIYTRPMIKIIERIVSSYSKNFIGADVVEVLPMIDNNQVTALTAATLLWSSMSACAQYFRVDNDA